MITRRGFMAGILAASTAPALVRAGMLMPVKTIVTPKSFLEMMTDEWNNWHMDVGDQLDHSMSAVTEGLYTAFIHPDYYAELVRTGSIVLLKA